MSTAMRQLVIHAGFHKTGTSYLQNLFLQHGDCLRSEHKLLFPRVGIKDLSHLRPDAISGHDGLLLAARINFDAVFRDIEYSVAGSCAIFLSAENLLHPNLSKETMVRNILTLKSKFYNTDRVLLLLSFKDPAKMIRSLYKEFVCGGNMLYRKNIDYLVGEMSQYGEKVNYAIRKCRENGIDVVTVDSSRDIISAVVGGMSESGIDLGNIDNLLKLSTSKKYEGRTDSETLLALTINRIVRSRTTNRAIFNKLASEMNKHEGVYQPGGIIEGLADRVRSIYADALGDQVQDHGDFEITDFGKFSADWSRMVERVCQDMKSSLDSSAARGHFLVRKAAPKAMNGLMSVLPLWRQSEALKLAYMTKLGYEM